MPLFFSPDLQFPLPGLTEDCPRNALLNPIPELSRGQQERGLLGYGSFLDKLHENLSMQLYQLEWQV